MRAVLLALVLTGCGGSPALHADPRYDVAAARARASAAVAWSPWAAETFARARAEGRFILVDGVA
ncbi:MAG: hypothetical protein R3F60_17815, partial [bacterium]